MPAQGDTGARDILDDTLAQYIREGVNARRRLHYPDTKLAVLTLGQRGAVADVNAIDEALMDQGAPTGMTRTCRSLRNLVADGTW